MLERHTIYQASKKLGISESAVRQRIHRGTLESGKDENGRLVVYLERNGTTATNYNGDISPVVQDYITALKSQIETLEHDKEHLREESVRKDTIIMSLTKRIPAIEAPQTDADDSIEPRESTLSDSETTGNGAAVSHDQAEAKIQLPWWKRLFQ